MGLNDDIWASYLAYRALPPQDQARVWVRRELRFSFCGAFTSALPHLYFYSVFVFVD
jgi:hypothetical protein